MQPDCRWVVPAAFRAERPLLFASDSQQRPAVARTVEPADGRAGSNAKGEDCGPTRPKSVVESADPKSKLIGSQLRSARPALLEARGSGREGRTGPDPVAGLPQCSVRSDEPSRGRTRGRGDLWRWCAQLDRTGASCECCRSGPASRWSGQKGSRIVSAGSAQVTAQQVVPYGRVIELKRTLTVGKAKPTRAAILTPLRQTPPPRGLPSSSVP